VHYAYLTVGNKVVYLNSRVTVVR